MHCGKGKPRKAGNHKQKKENKQTQDFLHLSLHAPWPTCLARAASYGRVPSRPLNWAINGGWFLLSSPKTTTTLVQLLAPGACCM